MRKDRYSLNIDRLEVCYTASTPLAQELRDTAYMERDGYRITAVESENKGTTLQIDITAPEERL